MNKQEKYYHDLNPSIVKRINLSRRLLTQAFTRRSFEKAQAKYYRSTKEALVDMGSLIDSIKKLRAKGMGHNKLYVSKPFVPAGRYHIDTQKEIWYLNTILDDLPMMELSITEKAELKGLTENLRGILIKTEQSKLAIERIEKKLK